MLIVKKKIYVVTWNFNILPFLSFQLSYVRTYHSKLTRIAQDMNSIEDRVARLKVG